MMTVVVMMVVVMVMVVVTIIAIIICLGYQPDHTGNPGDNDGVLRHGDR